MTTTTIICGLMLVTLVALVLVAYYAGLNDAKKHGAVKHDYLDNNTEEEKDEEDEDDE